MNNVVLVGRITKDIEVKYTPSQMAVVKNTIAINRTKDETDFIPVTFFGRTAENLEMYVQKGGRVIINGHIQSGSYEKDGKKVYTLDVICDKLEIVDFKEKKEEPTPKFSAIEIEEDIPF